MKKSLAEETSALMEAIDRQTNLLCVDNKLSEREGYIVHSAMLIGAMLGIEYEAKAALERMDEVYTPSWKTMKAIQKRLKEKKNGKR
jgi:hypothetical protein